MHNASAARAAPASSTGAVTGRRQARSRGSSNFSSMSSGPSTALQTTTQAPQTAIRRSTRRRSPSAASGVDNNMVQSRRWTRSTVRSLRLISGRLTTLAMRSAPRDAWPSDACAERSSSLKTSSRAALAVARVASEWASFRSSTPLDACAATISRMRAAATLLSHASAARPAVAAFNTSFGLRLHNSRKLRNLSAPSSSGLFFQ